MKRKIALTEEQFTALMQAAYLDGADDGYKTTDSFDQFENGDAWTESVTRDIVDHEIEKARNK